MSIVVGGMTSADFSRDNYTFDGVRLHDAVVSDLCLVITDHNGCSCAAKTNFSPSALCADAHSVHSLPSSWRIHGDDAVVDSRRTGTIINSRTNKNKSNRDNHIVVINRSGTCT